MSSPFHDHLDMCEQCRESPFNLCPDGQAALRAEVGTMPQSAAQQVEHSARRGKRLALRMMEWIEEEDMNSPPTIIHALAFMFSGMLTAMDGESTISEKMGLGLLSDNDRLALFCEEVRGMAQLMRSERTTGKGVM